MNQFRPANQTDGPARRRLRIVFILMGVALVVISGRLVQLQLVRGAELAQQARGQQVTRVPLVGLRGTIYDRNGIPLALDRESPTAFAAPNEIEPEEKGRVAEELAGILGLSAEDTRRLLERDSYFVWLSRHLDAETADRLRQASLPGVYVRQEPSRLYPLGRTAAHVLGFVGIDHQGLEGMELAYDDLLSGEPGWTLKVRDALGRPLYPLDEPSAASYASGEPSEASYAPGKTLQPPQRGNDLRLTIDSRFQHIVDRELAYAVERSNGRGGMAVMLDPDTGDVLALSNYPFFDPNRFGEYPSWVRRNRIVTDVYEPGSTFKVFTLAAALEEGLVTPQTVFDTPGETYVTGRRIRDSLPHDPRLTATQIIERSSNVGILQIGLKVGRDKLRDYLGKFGFGALTGLEIPGEVRGILRPASEWYPLDTACASFGQGVAVTAIQLVRAYAVIANGGWLVQPSIVSRENSRKPRPRRVISPETAAALREILIGAVERGLGKDARGSGYTIGGKTGTAQKVGEGGYLEGKHYIASFIGFAPAQDPALVLLIIVDEPRPIYGGGPVCGPAFARIVRQVLALEGVSAPGGATARLVRADSPEVPCSTPSAAGSPLNLLGLNARKAAAVLAARGVPVEMHGSGRVVAVSTGGDALSVQLAGSR
ncbi:MAG TPA: penicillin-binding protein 2 [bacterium]|nr:penicillin-binding protein 2 [bacterium]